MNRGATVREGTSLMLYQALKKIVSVCFNLFNLLLLGNLPPFGCVSVVVEENARFLVVELSNKKVVFPGGFMRWRERPDEAAIREGKEETGLLLRTGNVIGYLTYASRQFTRMSTIDIIYEGEVVGGTLRSSIEGCSCWLHEGELRDRLNQDNRAILEAYLRYRNERSQAKAH